MLRQAKGEVLIQTLAPDLIGDDKPPFARPLMVEWAGWGRQDAHQRL